MKKKIYEEILSKVTAKWNHIEKRVVVFYEGAEVQRLELPGVNERASYNKSPCFKGPAMRFSINQYDDEYVVSVSMGDFFFNDNVSKELLVLKLTVAAEKPTLRSFKIKVLNWVHHTEKIMHIRAPTKRMALETAAVRARKRWRWGEFKLSFVKQ